MDKCPPFCSNVVEKLNRFQLYRHWNLQDFLANSKKQSTWIFIDFDFSVLKLFFKISLKQLRWHCASCRLPSSQTEIHQISIASAAVPILMLLLNTCSIPRNTSESPVSLVGLSNGTSRKNEMYNISKKQNVISFSGLSNCTSREMVCTTFPKRKTIALRTSFIPINV